MCLVPYCRIFFIRDVFVIKQGQTVHRSAVIDNKGKRQTDKTEEYNVNVSIRQTYTKRKDKKICQKIS